MKKFLIIATCSWPTSRPAPSTPSPAPIMDCFQQINEAGTTVIIVTHDEKIAARCRRIIRIENGKIME